MGDPTALRADATAIRNAAIAACDPASLVAAALSVPGVLDLGGIERVVVVGAGKAAAGMAAGVAAAFGALRLERHRVSGLVSVPEGTQVSLTRIEVRATRPGRANLPTAAVERATREILDMLAALGPRDLAIAVVSGGGSALLEAPRAGVALADISALTQRLAASGADIAALNAARRELSAVKMGGLARACRAGRLLVLVLSDVIGGDLDVIASGPCMPGVPTAPAGAWTTPSGCVVRHVVVGTNATAVDAAARHARTLGYDVLERHALPDSPTQAAADDVGRRLAAEGIGLLTAARRDGRPRARVEGGESTVVLPDDHGVGGRNQQTVVAALEALQTRGGWPDGLLIESLGTDGEDGPTTAAGGCIDAGVAAAIAAAGLDVAGARARRDAYPLLAAAGGLVVTGPTGTNVCDVRIILARP
ncbi:MAG: DUF4147 domain-containing protein [Planctomycetaceae bacterium]